MLYSTMVIFAVFYEMDGVVLTKTKSNIELKMPLHLFSKTVTNVIDFNSIFHTSVSKAELENDIRQFEKIYASRGTVIHLFLKSCNTVVVRVHSPRRYLTKSINTETSGANGTYQASTTR